MKRKTSRRWVLMLVALTAVAAGFLAPAPASAEKRLFRIQRSGFGAPFPPVRLQTHTVMSGTTPKKGPAGTGPNGMTYPVYGGAGRGENYVEPFRETLPKFATRTVTTTTPTFNTMTNKKYFVGLPSTAIVSPMNPIGGMFTLPRSFIKYSDVNRYYSSTGFTGYTSFSYAYYVNGRGRFRKNNPYAPTMTANVLFPTTGGNPAPNYGKLGYPVTSTTTFDAQPDGIGDFGFSKAGSIAITPGPNRFGGTMRVLYDTKNSKFSQYIAYYAPLYFRAYGSFNQKYMGAELTQDLETQVMKVMTPTRTATGTARWAGQITSTGMVTRFLLDQTKFDLGTVKTHFGMSDAKSPGTMTMAGKATTGFYRKIATPYVKSRNYYLHVVAPWTTGKAAPYNIETFGNFPPIKPVLPKTTPADKTYPGGMDVTVTRTYTNANYPMGGGMVTYKYYTHMELLKGVTRAVSLVRPRLNHAYSYPSNPTDSPNRPYTAARIAMMKVYFLPEPGALLLLGSAVAGLAGLYLLRRR